METDDWVKRLGERLAPYCQSVDMRIAYLASGGVDVYPILKVGASREAAEAVLAEFAPYIRHSEVFEPMFTHLLASLIAACRFEEFECLVRQELLNFIETIATHGVNDRLYGISVWVDTGNCNLDFAAHSVPVFERALAQKQRTSPQHYSTEDQIRRYKYYEHISFDREVSAPLREMLGLHGELTYAAYKRYGERFLARGEPLYSERLVDHLANALNAVTPIMRELNVSDGFVSYIRLYDSSYLDEYRALRRTLSRSDAERIIPPHVWVP